MVGKRGCKILTILAEEGPRSTKSLREDLIQSNTGEDCVKRRQIKDDLTRLYEKGFLDRETKPFRLNGRPHYYYIWRLSPSAFKIWERYGDFKNYALVCSVRRLAIQLGYGAGGKYEKRLVDFINNGGQ